MNTDTGAKNGLIDEEDDDEENDEEDDEDLTDEDDGEDSEDGGDEDVEGERAEPLGRLHEGSEHAKDNEVEGSEGVIGNLHVFECGAAGLVELHDHHLDVLNFTDNRGSDVHVLMVDSLEDGGSLGDGVQKHVHHDVD